MRRQSLEAELHRLGDAADEALWEVYGDALLEEGDPRGELVALALAEGRAKSKREAGELAARAAKVRARLDPIGHQAECDAILTDVEWTYGFLSAARVQEVWRQAGRAAFVLERLATTDAGAFLRSLALAQAPPGDDYSDEELESRGDPPIFDWAERALEGLTLPRVRELHLGTEPDAQTMLNAGSSYMFTSAAPGTPGARISRPSPFFGDPSKILRSMPSLTSLRMSGECVTFDPSSLPRSLWELTVETRFLRASTLAAIGEAHLPELESLELWLGNWPDSAPDFEPPEPELYYGRRTGAADLASILTGDRLPKLKHLGLTNCAWMAEVASALAESSIAPRLETIDLSYGFMADDQVRPLVRARGRFERLRRIDLSYNQIRSPEVVMALKEAFGKALLLGVQDDLEADPIRSLFAF